MSLLEDIILSLLCPEESTLGTKVFKVKHSPADKFKLETLEEEKKLERFF